MAAPTTYPAWETRENSRFTLRLSADASFGGSREGSTYYVTLPGHGLAKCWNRAEVERVCRDYLDQLEARPDEEDPEYPEWDRACSAGDRAYQFAKEQA